MPDDASAYDVAFWTIETAVAALEHPQLDAKRAESLAQAMGERLSVDVERRLMPDEQAEHCLRALSSHLYKVLIAGAGADPDRACEQLDELADRTEKYLDANTLDGLATDFLLAVLPMAPDEWRKHRSLIRRAVRSENWGSVLV